MLPDRQGGCQLQGVGPVGQVGSDGDAGFQDLPLVARLQQLGGLLRPQPERCYGPWPDAGLGSRLGHGAGHGAGRRRGVAPAGQPGDGEAVVVRFEAGRFGQELRLGAVGVFSSRLPVGRRQACPGVLAPEDEISFDLGGVQDEHGFVRCCVGMSVCYGAGVWQGLAGLGTLQAKQVEGSTGFWCGAAGRFRVSGLPAGLQCAGAIGSRSCLNCRGFPCRRCTGRRRWCRRRVLVISYCLPGRFRERPLPASWWMRS